MPPFMGLCGIFSAMTGKKLAVVSTISEEGLKSSLILHFRTRAVLSPLSSWNCLQNFHWDCILFFLAAIFSLQKISWKI
jgi:hypothetical protein